jgi:hypothetical protein
LVGIPQAGLHFHHPGYSGAGNAAIRFPGIVTSAGQIGDQLPRAEIAFYFVSNPGTYKTDMLTWDQHGK